jgi:hypothetical protein
VQTRYDHQTYWLSVEHLHRSAEAHPPASTLGTVRTEAHQALGRIAEVLKETGAVGWVTYGTLLGLIREGDVLDHDNDLDIAILSGTTPQAITAGLAARGFRLAEQQRGPRGLRLQKFDFGPVRADFSYLFIEGGKLADESVIYSRSVVRGYHRPTARTIPRQFGGVELPLPEEPEAYLAVLYGPHWRTPVKRWINVKSPPNAELLLHWRDMPFHALRVIYLWFPVLRRIREYFRVSRAT